tara:strand:- start:1979 stop:2812 length:834 start_codon:yes stop_codon:yes gene_type:complete
MDKNFDNFKKIGEEDHNPDLSPQQGDDPLDTGDIDNSQGAGGTPDNLWIGNKTKVTTGYGIGKCSHSSTSGLHSMKKTGKLKVVAASIGEADDVGTEEEPMPALKPPVDVYKAPTGTDEENMGGVVEIRKIATESDTTSPMEVREQGENVVIIGGGLDETVTVRTTDSATSARIMTWQDGILKESNTGTYTPPAYGKHLNLVVHSKSYTRVTIEDNVGLASSPYLRNSYYNMMKAATTGQTTATYYWRNGLYVGTVDPADGLGTTVNVDYWADNTPP